MNPPDMIGSVICRGEVRAEWIDVNDHMNVAYYVLAFDTAVDALWEQFGITENHINVSQSSTFATLTMKRSSLCASAELKSVRPCGKRTNLKTRPGRPAIRRRRY